jgi:hypothetical protein
MTITKHGVISILFNLFNSNQAADPETLMMATDAILVGHWITWKDRETFKNKISNELIYVQRRYQFSILAIATMDFALFEIKKVNGTLVTNEIF